MDDQSQREAELAAYNAALCAFIDDITPNRASVMATAKTEAELAGWRHASKTGRVVRLRKPAAVGERIWLGQIISHPDL